MMKISATTKFAEYRNDIDGLRAISVIAVIIYHLNDKWLKGGYLGVDVFFVLSGYVVLTSLLTKNNGPRFYFFKNYLFRRMKRLFPALFITIVTTGIGTALFISPKIRDLKSYFKTGKYAFIGWSNNYLLRTKSAYFTPSSELNPFTHTWSLGVEEQFYLCFAILFALCIGAKGIFKKKIFLYATGLLSFLSISFYLYLNLNTQSMKAFYLMPARFWQLGLGCLMCQVKPKLIKRKIIPETICSISTVLLVSIFFIEIESHHYLLNILITLLTCLLITLLPQTSFLKRALSSTLFTRVGKLSYALYLVHWPILVLSQWTFARGENKYIGVKILLITSLAILIHNTIENKIRFLKLKGHQRKYFFAGIIFIAILFTLVKNNRSHLYLGTPPESNSSVVLRCVDKKFPEVLIFGDSHSRAITPVIAAITKGRCNNAGLKVYGVTKEGYDKYSKKTPIIDIHMGKEAKVIEKVKELSPKKILIAHYLKGVFSPLEYSYNSRDGIVRDYYTTRKRVTNNYQKGLEYFIEDIENIVNNINPLIQVIILMPLPDFNWIGNGGLSPEACNEQWFRPLATKGSDCYKLDNPPRVKMSEVKRRIRHIEKSFSKLSNKYPNIVLYDPVPHICAKGICSPKLRGNLIYKDDDHINYEGAMLLKSSLSKLIN